MEQRPRKTERCVDYFSGEIDVARVPAWPPVLEYISQVDGLTVVLKLGNSDSRKAWALMKFAFRCPSPDKLVKIY